MGICEDCEFWNAHADSEMGSCRRRAPQMIEATTNPKHDPDERLWAVWPETFCEWSCGEFEARS